MVQFRLIREFYGELFLQIGWSKVAPSDTFDALMEMAVQKDQIVDSGSLVQFVEELDGELVHMMASLHEEDAVEQVQMLLELAVGLDLV